MSSEQLHEAEALLSEETKNKHRAIISLIEELDAVDWYQQRAEACSDAELAAVLIHNKEEEVEHAMMTLEWLIRNDEVFAENARKYLFTNVPIAEIEETEERRDATAAPARRDGSLGIGSLKE